MDVTTYAMAKAYTDKKISGGGSASGGGKFVVTLEQKTEYSTAAQIEVGAMPEIDQDSRTYGYAFSGAFSDLIGKTLYFNSTEYPLTYSSEASAWGYNTVDFEHLTPIDDTKPVYCFGYDQSSDEAMIASNHTDLANTTVRILEEETVYTADKSIRQILDANTAGKNVVAKSGDDGYFELPLTLYMDYEEAGIVVFSGTIVIEEEGMFITAFGQGDEREAEWKVYEVDDVPLKPNQLVAHYTVRTVDGQLSGTCDNTSYDEIASAIRNDIPVICYAVVDGTTTFQATNVMMGGEMIVFTTAIYMSGASYYTIRHESDGTITVLSNT